MDKGVDQSATALFAVQVVCIVNDHKTVRLHRARPELEASAGDDAVARTVGHRRDEHIKPRQQMGRFARADPFGNKEGECPCAAHKENARADPQLLEDKV